MEAEAQSCKVTYHRVSQVTGKYHESKFSLSDSEVFAVHPYAFFHYCFIVYLLKESEAFGPCKGLCRLLNVNCFVITPSLKNLELLSRVSTNF